MGGLRGPATGGVAMDVPGRAEARRKGRRGRGLERRENGGGDGGSLLASGVVVPSDVRARDGRVGVEGVGAGRLVGSVRAFGLFQLGAAAFQLGEEALGEAYAAGSAGVLAELGAGCEGAEVGIEDDLVDDLAGGLGALGGEGDGSLPGQVERGDLEAVEKESGAARVDLVGGDAAEDVGDGELEAGAVGGVGEGEVKGGLAAAAGAWLSGGFAGGVVEVAELFGAERGRSAAAAVGVDVAALEAFGCGFGDGVGHGVYGGPHPWCFRAKS